MTISFAAAARPFSGLRKACGLLILALLLGLCPTAHAQVTLRGTVIDKDTKEALPFASVSVNKTTIGTTTNIEGEFSLSVVGWRNAQII